MDHLVGPDRSDRKFARVPFYPAFDHALLQTTGRNEMPNGTENVRTFWSDRNEMTNGTGISELKWKIPFHSIEGNYGRSNRKFSLNGLRPVFQKKHIFRNGILLRLIISGSDLKQSQKNGLDQASVPDFRCTSGLASRLQFSRL